MPFIDRIARACPDFPEDLDADSADERVGTPCGAVCGVQGECLQSREDVPPAFADVDGTCLWRGENGQTEGWYERVNQRRYIMDARRHKRGQAVMPL